MSEVIIHLAWQAFVNGVTFGHDNHLVEHVHNLRGRLVDCSDYCHTLFSFLP